MADRPIYNSDGLLVGVTDVPEEQLGHREPMAGRFVGAELTDKFPARTRWELRLEALEELRAAMHSQTPDTPA